MLRSPLAEEFAQQFSAFFCQLAARYQHLVVKLGVVQDLENRTGRARLWIGGGIDEPAKPGMDHRPGAHGAGFQGDEKLAAAQSIVAQGPRRLSQRDDLCVRGRIKVAQDPVLSPAHNDSIFDDNRTYRYFARSTRGTRFV